MTYTRLLKLDDDTEAALIQYLNTELTTHRAERSRYDEQLVDWNQDYWAEPVVKEKTFPFQGACSIIIPLTAIAVESIHADTMTSVFGLPDTLNVTPRAPEFADAARDWENFINYTMESTKFRRRMESSILELEKFGTGVGKIKYEKVTRYGMKDIAGEEVEFPVVVSDGPVPCTVSLSRFVMPFSAQDTQTAPWCGELHTSTPDEIARMEEEGFFDKKTFEKVANFSFINNQDDKKEWQQAENEKRTPVISDKRVNYYEIWCDFKVEGKLPDYMLDYKTTIKKRAIQVFFHYDSQTIMGVRYNTHSDLRRPYRTGVYIPVENRWPGIGVCKQNDQFQLEVTIQHRQRIDNATIANIRMFKVAKMSGYGPREPIFPGKMWFLDDMKDIESFQVGEIYPSSYNNEQQTLLYSQQRTGVNDLSLGMQQAGTPGTATSDLARVQEGKKKSDYIKGNIKDYLTDLSYDMFDVMQTYGSRNVTYLSLNDPSGVVSKILTMPNEAIRDAAVFKINISGQSSNQILDQQNFQQLSQFTVQYWTQMMQLAMQTGNPQLMQDLTIKAMMAGTDTYTQILQNMNIKNIDRLIIDPKMLQTLMVPPQQPQQQLMGAEGDPNQLLIGGGNQGTPAPQ